MRTPTLLVAVLLAVACCVNSLAPLRVAALGEQTEPSTAAVTVTSGPHVSVAPCGRAPGAPPCVVSTVSVQGHALHVWGVTMPPHIQRVSITASVPGAADTAARAGIVVTVGASAPVDGTRTAGAALLVPDTHAICSAVNTVSATCGAVACRELAVQPSRSDLPWARVTPPGACGACGAAWSLRLEVDAAMAACVADHGLTRQLVAENGPECVPAAAL